jgi:hypothetical protein
MTDMRKETEMRSLIEIEEADPESAEMLREARRELALTAYLSLPRARRTVIRSTPASRAASDSLPPDSQKWTMAAYKISIR